MQNYAQLLEEIYIHLTSYLVYFNSRLYCLIAGNNLIFSCELSWRKQVLTAKERPGFNPSAVRINVI